MAAACGELERRAPGLRRSAGALALVLVLALPFARPAGGAELSYLGRVTDPILASGAGVMLSPDGRHAYVPIDGGIAVFARDADTGWLEFASAALEGEEGFTGVDGWIFDSPDGAFFYVVELDRLAILARDPDTGALTQVDLLEGEDLGEGPDAARILHTIVISEDGRHLYLFAHERSAALGSLVLPLVLLFERDATTGALTLLDEAPLEEPTFTSYGVYGAVASPDGARLWTTLHGLAAFFTRDAVTGSLSPPQLADGTFPYVIGQMLPSPDGRHFYMTAGWERGIWAYEIGEGDALIFLGHIEDGAGPSPPPEYCRDFCEPPEALARLGLVFDATGERLYGATEQPSAVIVFARDPTSARSPCSRSTTATRSRAGSSSAAVRPSLRTGGTSTSSTAARATRS
jgi:6-phosphogluconolactonase (cycloisomerase 2 family)